MDLLSNVNFVEQLLRGYLGSYQDQFITRKNKSFTAGGSPCTLIYTQGVDICFIELERRVGDTPKTYISLFETISYDREEHVEAANNFPGLKDIPAGISRIVAIDVFDPRGQETLRDIVKDTLCELSAESQKKT
ncbi:MAG: hypothetical protein ACW963_02620 [Candidatus Sifarchaeia archaeon]|jgi:hypothetical protein